MLEFWKTHANAVYSFLTVESSEKKKNLQESIKYR